MQTINRVKGQKSRIEEEQNNRRVDYRKRRKIEKKGIKGDNDIVEIREI